MVAVATRTWVLITGEYPPQPGGVADYCQLLARALVAAGDVVHLCMPAVGLARLSEAGLTFHELPGRYDRASLALLTTTLAQVPTDATLILQYVPQAFGAFGMNWRLVLALTRDRAAPLWTMFHEVAMPLTWRQRPHYLLMAVVQRWMARRLLRASTQIFVSIPRWRDLLTNLEASGPPAQWLPVPSNVAGASSGLVAAALKRSLGIADKALIVGHFGTFGPGIRPYLEQVLPQVLARMPSVHVLLIGYGAQNLATTLRQRATAARVHLAPESSPSGVATALQISDVLFQPYPDGASTRRSSLMAGLSLGRAIVTTQGALSEDLWITSGAVVAVPCTDPSAMLAAIVDLIVDPVERSRLGATAKEVYAAKFAWEHVVSKVRAA